MAHDDDHPQAIPEPRTVLTTLGQLRDLLKGELDPSNFHLFVDGFDRVFLHEAWLAAERSRVGFEQKASLVEAGGAAAAILLSAAACEAWLSEFLAFVELEDPEDKEELLALRHERDAQQQHRRLLSLRVPDFDFGRCNEYQALGCLFKLRDHVAHRSARLLTLKAWPPRLTDCIRQGQIPIRNAPMADWTSVTFVREVAEWATMTASNWLSVIHSALGPLPHRDITDEHEFMNIEDIISDHDQGPETQ